MKGSGHPCAPKSDRLGTPAGKLLSLAAMLMACAAPIAAQGQQALPRCPAATESTKPCVDKVDPPDWWVGLPSPMLLLHGANLTGARFSAAGAGVTLKKSQVSDNGHYAFLWLTTAGAGSQVVKIGVGTGAARISVPFRIERRTTAPHAGFSPSDVMYLIMTDRFADGDASNDPNPGERSVRRGWHGGDFRGIQQHLDYLQQLGVTTIWLTPVVDNDGGAQAYHGYSATDLYATDPHFGTVADLRSLADALHQRGMKLVLDTVPNHVGAANPWAFDPPTPDWFHGTRADHRIASDRFQTIVDPHASWDQRRDVTQGWFANVLPDLNQENPLVRQYLIQDTIWWIEKAGADGLRYDTFPYVGRTYWQALDEELATLYPRLTTVGEVFNPNPVITSYFAGGVTRGGVDTGLTTPFDFPTFFALRRALVPRKSFAGEPEGGDGLKGLENVLRDDWLYPHPERLVTFIGNHDTVRFLSQPGATVADLKLAFALLATLRGMPQIYSGDEIAMRGGEDPENRHDFPGGFPGDTQNAFTAAGRTPEQADVHDWLAALLRFRREHAEMATGQQQNLFVDPTTFVFVRSSDVQHGCGNGSERMLVAVNDAAQARSVTLPVERTALANCTRLTGELGSTATVQSDGSQITLELAAKQAVIYRAE